MPPRRKSTIEQNREAQTPIQQDITHLAETTEDDERKLLLKLSRKYKDETTGGRVPGRIVRGEKTSWTYQDMVKRFPIVSFIPDDTIPLTWNGVKVQAITGLEMHVPKPFYEIYQRRKASMRPQKAPPGIIVELGAGAFPAE